MGSWRGPLRGIGHWGVKHVILRAKWLIKLEEEEDLGVLSRFKERHTKDYYNVVIKRYFLIDKLYILIELY